jgi:hypothetical protein
MIDNKDSSVEEIEQSLKSRSSHLNNYSGSLLFKSMGAKKQLTTITEENSLNETRSLSRGRPSSANSVASRKSFVSNRNSIQVKSKPTQQVGVPIVSFKGPNTCCEIAGLTPNRLYHFRLRYVGSRSYSLLSPPFVIMTIPLPPSNPILIEINSTLVRIKWYPPEYGASKFIVQLKVIASSKITSMKRINVSVSTEIENDGWISVYNGLENIWTSTTLSPDTNYYARILAVNFQGNCSEPSEPIRFKTLPRSDSKEQLNSKNIGSIFHIECTGDICVGDNILITERIFLRGDSKGNAMNEKQQFDASHISSNYSKKLDSNKLTKSLTNNNSLYSAKGNVSISADHGEFIGERTIVAFVAKDNYRTIRNLIGQTEIGQHRKLWLEVVWQRSSNDSCKPFDLKIGEVLERQQSHLEKFEVFRSVWTQEKLRKPLIEEWNSFVDSFVNVDC